MAGTKQKKAVTTIPAQTDEGRTGDCQTCFGGKTGSKCNDGKHYYCGECRTRERLCLGCIHDRSMNATKGQ